MAVVTRQIHQIFPFQVDPLRRLTIPSLIDLMHIAAWENSAVLGASVYDLHKQGITWAMIKYRLEVFRYPGHDEKLSVESWPSGFERSFVYRDYRAYDPAGQLVAQASSTWLVMDLHTRKMTQIRDFIIPLLQVPEGCHPLPRASEKLRPLAGTNPSQAFPVRWHELDANGHVANTMYFLWALEALGADWLNAHELTNIEVQFRSELRSGQEVLSTYQQEEEGVISHDLRRKSDDKVVALARSQWKNNPS